MIEEPATLPEGNLKRIHVDQHRIRSNKRDGTDLPVLTVQARGGPFKAHEVEVVGPSTIVYRGDALSCGARCWIETRSEVRVILRNCA